MGELKTGSFAHLVIEEPLLVQRIEGTVGFQACYRGVDRGDQIGTLREDEAEVLGAERAADDLQTAARGIDIALGCDAVGQHDVDVAGLQRLYRGTEGLEQLDARVLLVAVEDLVDRSVEGGGTRLRADEAVVESAEGLGI